MTYYSLRKIFTQAVVFISNSYEGTTSSLSSLIIIFVPGLTLTSIPAFQEGDVFEGFEDDKVDNRISSCRSD